MKDSKNTNEVVLIGNEIYEGFVTEEKASTTEQEVLEELNEMKKRKEDETIFKVKVTAANRNGDLLCSVEGYNKGYFTYLVPRREFKDLTGKPYKIKYKHQKVGREFNVIIIDVSEHTKTIRLSVSKAKGKVRPAIEQRLKELLEDGKKPRIQAVIEYVSPKTSRVVIDIAGVGIKGEIPAAQWEWGWTKDIRESAQYGETVTIDVIEYREPLKDDEVDMDEYFLCSRQSTLKSPWVGIEKRFQEDSIIEVKVTDVKNKSCFGKLESLPEIDILLERPKDTSIKVVKGLRYQAYVYHVSEKNEAFRAKIFKCLDQPDFDM